MMISRFNHLRGEVNRRNLLITKSDLSVFIHLKYTALMEHIEYRHIYRETSSQISLASSNLGDNPGGRLKKLHIFAPKSSQTTNPQMKFSFLYSFQIMQFDTSTKIQILWCVFIAEVGWVTGAAAVNDLESFVTRHQN